MTVVANKFTAPDQAAAIAGVAALTMSQAAKDAATAALGGIADAEGRDMLVTLSTDVVSTGGTSFAARRITVDVESVVRAEAAE